MAVRWLAQSAGERFIGSFLPGLLFFLAVLLSAPVYGVGDEEILWPWDEPGVADAGKRYFKRLFAMDYDGCSAIVDSLEAARPDDPIVQILRARIVRDLVREVDITREERERQFEEFDKVLGKLRDVAQARLAEDPGDPRPHLALGWEGMVKGQVQVMLKDFLAANSTSKKAREHLDKVLEIHPESPDAKALLGGYLYSVDALPKFLKILKWIPFLPIPSGDRDEGLRLLTESGRSSIPPASDYRLFAGFLDVFYEGNFRRSESVMGELFYENPHNPRFGITMSLITPFDPSEGLMGVRHWRLLHEAWRSRAEPGRPWWLGWDRWSVTLAVRMNLLAAYQWEALGQADRALALYEELASNPMARSQRMRGQVQLGIARTSIQTGDGEKARRAVSDILDDKSLKPWHDASKDLKEEIERKRTEHDLPLRRSAAEPLIAVLEEVPSPGIDGTERPNRIDRRPFPRSQLRRIEALARSSGNDPVVGKLLGDAYALAGLPEQAIETYDGAMEGVSAPSLWAIRLQIHLSRAFLSEALGRNRDALDAMNKAIDEMVEQDLLRYPADARLDALERLAKR
jgi:tetratricopeptide (TPR) repeat protein